MGVAKRKTTKSKGGGVIGKAVSSAKSLLGTKSSGAKRRSRGPTYYANKILVAKLKKKLYKIKYGGK